MKQKQWECKIVTADDIGPFAGKEQMLRAFEHTANELGEEGWKLQSLVIWYTSAATFVRRRQR